MRSLVTGGCGFIGAHVAEACRGLGHEVVVLDDLSGGFEDNLPPGVEFVKGSVTDHDLVDKLFASYRFDYVYHLAAYAAEGLSHFIRRFNYTNNVLGSINLINASVNAGSVKRFVFTSSIAVYGTNQLPMTEELTPEPEDPYGIAKYSVELDLRAAAKMFGLSYTIFRPHNVYGVKQNLWDRYRNVIGIFFNQMMRGEPVTVFGDGLQTRAFSEISSVAPLIARSVEVEAARNEVFNVGADQPYSVLDLVRATAEAMGCQPNIIHLEARKEVAHAYASHEKAKRVFGESPQTPLAEGLARMAVWAKARGSRSGVVFSAVEVRKNLPESWSAGLADAGGLSAEPSIGAAE